MSTARILPIIKEMFWEPSHAKLSIAINQMSVAIRIGKCAVRHTIIGNQCSEFLLQNRKHLRKFLKFMGVESVS